MHGSWPFAGTLFERVAMALKKSLTQKQYVEAHGVLCPVCCSSDLQVTSPLDVLQDGITLVRDIKCDTCQCTFRERMKLVGYDSLDGWRSAEALLARQT